MNMKCLFIRGLACARAPAQRAAVVVAAAAVAPQAQYSRARRKLFLQSRTRTRALALLVPLLGFSSRYGLLAMGASCERRRLLYVTAPRWRRLEVHVVVDVEVV